MLLLLLERLPEHTPLQLVLMPQLFPRMRLHQILPAALLQNLQVFQLLSLALLDLLLLLQTPDHILILSRLPLLLVSLGLRIALLSLPQAQSLPLRVCL